MGVGFCFDGEDLGVVGYEVFYALVLSGSVSVCG